MRREWVGLLFILVLFSLSPGQALAEKFEASKYVYRIKSGNCVQVPNIRIQTGFRAAGTKGIVTALHGVVGCKTITAKSGDDRVYRNLEIQKVDFKHDVALLGSKELAAEPADGLSVVSSAEEPNGDLYVIGYPLTIQGQHRLSRIVWYLYSPLQNYIPEYDLEALIQRKSPDLSIEIISLQAGLQPGHSGAPILTANGQVYGVADGGLKGGDAPISWAMPWRDITWRDVDQTAENELAKYPLSSLSFSSTFPDFETETLDTEDLRLTEPVHSYRAYTGVATSSRVGNEDINFDLVFETGYNEDGNRRSLTGFLQTPDAAQDQYYEEFLLLSADNQVYELPTIHSPYDCLKRDGIPEIIQPFAALTDELILNPVTEALSTVEVSNLGTEVLNGENTIHYLLSESIPIEVAEDGSPLVEMAAVEMWVTVADNQLRKFSTQIIGNEDSAASDQVSIGDIYMEIEYAEVNTDVTVELPLACQNAPFASEVISADNTGLISSGSRSTLDSEQVIAEPIPVEHNLATAQGPGISIRPTFTVNNMVDKPGVVIAQLFDEEGIPLQTYSPETGTLEGVYQAGTEFTPPYEQTTYENLEIFVPYSDLYLNDGVHDLKFRVVVYDLSTETVLAKSDLYDFSLWQQTDAGGNRSWFGDNYAGFRGLVTADQADISPLEQDIGIFLSHAIEAETWGYWYRDASVAEPYFSSELLVAAYKEIANLQAQGAVAAIEFEEQNSFIIDTNLIADNTVAVDACIYMDISYLDASNQPLSDQNQPITALVPTTLTLERSPGSWWLITDRVVYPEGLSCELK